MLVQKIQPCYVQWKHSTLFIKTGNNLHNVLIKLSFSSPKKSAVAYLTNSTDYAQIRRLSKPAKWNWEG